MKILKISQLQIQGLEEPVKNSELIKENLLKQFLLIQILFQRLSVLILLLVIEHIFLNMQLINQSARCWMYALSLQKNIRKLFI